MSEKSMKKLAENLENKLGNNEENTEAVETEAKEVVAEQAVLFSDLGLSKDILKAVKESGYLHPSPIQEKTIPFVLAGTDVLGQAQTGTGKTAAFALPTLSKIDLRSKKTQVLVLAPTRELAIQVSESFKTYAKYRTGLNVACIYGGQEYRTQINALRSGAHVVVGTPGRIMDHLRRETLDISKINTLVLDEADEMLRMGFIDDVEWILEKTPDTRQITLFSATMPREIKKITTKYLNNPEEVKIKSKTETASTITQRYIVMKANQKMTALTRVLEVENTDAVIIFAKTKSSTVDISDFLSGQGFRSIAINGDLQQNQRERAIGQLKSGRLDILVATDVAARGLDVPRISHVINYDVPQDNETYVHRIGRTGRAGRTGDAILFLTPKQRRLLTSIERTTKKAIDEFKMPGIEEINAKRVEYFKARITKVLEGTDNTAFEKIVSSYCEETGEDAMKVAAALAKIGQGKKPLLLTVGEDIGAGFSSSNERDGRGRNDRNDRFGRDDRGGRDGRTDGRDKRKSGKSSDANSQLYRIEAGRNDNIKPGNVVGAIANEAGLDGNLIGQIEIYDDYTTVSLPKGMPKGVMDSLKNARVAGKKMDISEVSGKQTGGGKPSGRGNYTDNPADRKKRVRKSSAPKGGSRDGDSRSGGRKETNSRTRKFK